MTLTEDDYDAIIGYFTKDKSTMLLFRTFVQTFVGKVPTDNEMAEILRGVADEIDPELE